MKRFVAVFLAVLMLFTAFASTASAQDVIEVRSTVFNGTDIDNIIDTYGNGTILPIDASRFPIFYYDIDDNVSTEIVFIADVPGTENNVIGEGGLVYVTRIQPIGYEYENPAAGWDNYSMIGFGARKFIPLNNNSADKLAMLVLDSDDKYTIRTGETLDLGQGYTLETKQVDVDGEKVWLEFQKDGEYVDDEIISVGTEGNTTGNTWDVELDDIEDEDDVVVLRVHVNQVFQGAVDSIAQIEGLWLIDYANARTIESDDEFGSLDDVSIQGDNLRISNEDTFTLTMDSEEEIAEGMFFKIGDTPVSELRYYPFVVRILGNETTTTPGDEENVTETPEENITEEGNVTETPEEDVTENLEETTEEETTNEATLANETEEGGTTPGFGVVFCLFGLLAAIYLFTRNK
ncbi:MAG: hypothetical protein QG610_1585 [Euryarchaeota archaeon]|nr:hypothetical protein [Euryarchaeota archaeon]